MKIGVFLPPDIPESFRVCIENITQRLPNHGCDLVFSDQSTELSRTDLVWDPRAGGGNPPHERVLNLGSPLIVTLHGVAPLAIPGLYTRGLRSRLSLISSNARKQRAWRRVHGFCERIVTVSEFSKVTINQHLKVPLESIEVVYNGVNTDLFQTDGSPYGPLSKQGPYFLHISNDERRKNVDRIVQAYAELDPQKRWPLVLKLSGRRRPSLEGVVMLTERLADEEIASLYRGAGAFVFPSLYEGFGLPIAEAMATGCPVITSNGNACAEVAGSAALLVDPLSVGAVKNAMLRVMDDECSLALRLKGLEQSKKFRWETAASEYARLFKQALDNPVVD